MSFLRDKDIVCFFKKSSFLNIQYIFLCFLFFAPFLSWIKFAPLVDLTSDLLSLFIALLIILFSFFYINDRVEISPALIIVSFLIFFSLFNINSTPYPGMVFIKISVLFFAALLANSVSKLDLEKVILFSSSGLLMGSLCQLFIGVFQITGLADQFDLSYFLHKNANYTEFLGNIGQRNNLSNYLMLGVLSLCWLFSKKQIKLLFFLIALIFLSISVSLSASRLVLAYLFISISLICFLFVRSKKTLEMKRLTFSIFLSVFFILIAQMYASDFFSFMLKNGVESLLTTGAERLQTGSFVLRFQEWSKAFSIFLDNPFFGVGLDSYAINSFRMVADDHVHAGVLFVNSHNILMQLFAELGGASVVIFLVCLLWSLFPRLIKEYPNENDYYLLSLILVFLCHSFFEYPLWYVNFLMVFSVLLGLVPVKKLYITFNKNIRIFTILVFSIIFLWQAILGVKMYSRWVYWVYPSKLEVENRARLDVLLQDSNHFIWSFYADGLIANYLPMNKENIEMKKELYQRLAYFRPYPKILTILSVYQAYDNDIENSEVTLRKAISAFPYSTEEIRLVLDIFEGDEIAHLKNILNKEKNNK